MKRRIAALAGVLLVGCAGKGPVAVDPMHSPVALAPVLDGCGWELGSVRDLRARRTAGAVAGKPIDVVGLERRIEAALVDAGVARAHTSGERLDVSILHAYGASKSVSKSFTTVLRAELGAERIQARGIDHTVNWNSTNAEIQRGILRSVDATARLLVDRLLPLCKNRDRENSEEMGTEDVKRVRL